MIPAQAIPNVEAVRLTTIFNALRREALSMIAEVDTGTVKLGDLVRSRLQAFIDYKEQINTLSAITGINAAYEALYPDSFTFVTEKDAIVAAVQALIDYIVTQIPKSGNYLSIVEFDVNYKLIQRTTSNAGAIAPLKTNAQAIVDLIQI